MQPLASADVAVAKIRKTAAHPMNVFILASSRELVRYGGERRPRAKRYVKVEPPAVETRRFPTRINLSNAIRSNRSIGRLPPINNLRFATPEIQLESTGVGANRSGSRPATTESRFGPGNLTRQRASRRV